MNAYSTPFKAVTFANPQEGAHLSDVVLRAPKDDEVLVRMEASGVCHSDLHVTNGDWPFDHDVVLGHEGSGRVVAAGPMTKGLHEGQRVTINWYAGCGWCDACRRAEPYLCTGTRVGENLLLDGSTPLTYANGGPELRPTLGVGTHADYVLANQSSVVVVPEEVPNDVAAIIGCAVTTGIGAVVNTARVPVGADCIVVGAGGVGQAIIMGLKLVGARAIIAIDINDGQLEIAERLGATHVFHGSDPNLPDLLARVVPVGVDFAFDAIGHPSTSTTLLDRVRPGGAGVLVGMPARGTNIPVDVWSAVALNKRLLGCNYGSSNPQVEFPRIARLYLAGRLPLDDLIGDHVSLGDVPAAIESLNGARGRRMVAIRS